VRPRCLGGKGGFGAMLRGQASRPGMKQVTPNTGAMRDLSGRRLRHVEQEQKLQEWQEDAGKRKAERDEERAEKKRQRAEEIHGEANDYVATAGIDAEEVREGVLKGIEEEKKMKELKKQADELKRKQDLEASKKLSSLFGDDDDSSSGASDTDQPPAKGKGASKKAPAAAKGLDEKPEGKKAKGKKGAEQKKAEAAAAEKASAATAQKAEAAPAEKADAAPAAAAAPPAEAAKPEVEHEDINVDKVKTLDDLLAMGGDRLKAALARRGMKCGGSPKDRAERLWSVKGLKKGDWPASVMAPPPKKK